MAESRSSSDSDDSTLQARWAERIEQFRSGDSPRRARNQRIEKLAVVFYTEGMNWDTLVSSYDDLQAYCASVSLDFDSQWTWYFPNHTTRESLVANTSTPTLH